MDPRAQKAKNLYDLYREERKHEERAKKTLQELERNNEQLQMTKMALLEKILDIQVKDELARNEQASRVSVPVAELNAEVIRENARHRIENEVRAHIDESRHAYADGFISHLEQLVQTDDRTARDEVRSMVDQYVDPHIELARRERRRAPDWSLAEHRCCHPRKSPAKSARSLKTNRKFRARKDQGDRVKRVEEAMRRLKRDIGDLQPLLHCVPVDYKTTIGVREAEINDLRATITAQRSEEERLRQEHRIRQSIIDSEESRLSAEVDAVCQQLVLMQRELETKESDLQEMAESQVPGSGSWASNTMQLERDLSLAIEEEFHLRHEAEEVKHTLDILNAEKSTSDAEIAQAIASLTAEQGEYQNVLSKIEEKLSTDKNKLYNLRESETEMTRRINELRYRVIHRREDVRRQKRDLRAVINTTISQLSIEDRLQSTLMAQSLELQKLAEKARSQSDHNIANLNNQLARVNNDLKTKNQSIGLLVETVANYYAGADHEKEVTQTPTQLMTQIDRLLKDWGRIEWEAASGVAQIASRVDHNTRENERVLKQMASYVVLQDDLVGEGVDIANTSTTELQQVRDHMYNELTQRSYREAKYTQCIRLLRDRQQLKARGESFEPLSKNRRIPLVERRARRETAERSRTARMLALDHLRRHGENADDFKGRSGSAAADVSGAATPTGALPAGTPPSANSASALHSPEFRLLVINFIKKEIQPLYDSSQLTKRRFVDVVARVSTWFLDTHKPAKDLTESNIGELVRKIQEVISWQDEERLKHRTDA